jgi:quercetin dioxygenase-like cupin family protein
MLIASSLGMTNGGMGRCEKQDRLRPDPTRGERANAESVPAASRRAGGGIGREFMDENTLAAKLVSEGFSRTYVWADAPGAQYPDHVHETETAHIILAGEMTLTMDGKAQTYRVGERCDVPADTVHAAEMGPRGCRYLIGERLGSTEEFCERLWARNRRGGRHVGDLYHAARRR